jgi:hypothetical protein
VKPAIEWARVFIASQRMCGVCPPDHALYEPPPPVCFSACDELIRCIKQAGSLDEDASSDDAQQLLSQAIDKVAGKCFPDGPAFAEEAGIGMRESISSEQRMYVWSALRDCASKKPDLLF